jgi:hypothetical protein
MSSGIKAHEHFQKGRAPGDDIFYRGYGGQGVGAKNQTLGRMPLSEKEILVKEM